MDDATSRAARRPPRVALWLLTAALSGCAAVAPSPAPIALPEQAALRVVQPEGGERRISLVEQSGQARVLTQGASRTLPVAAAHVLGMGLVDPDLAARIADDARLGVVLSGRAADPAGFRPDSLEAAEEDLQPAAEPEPGLPFYAPVLPRLHGETFGAERRAHWDGSLRQGLNVHCAPGSAPAGVSLGGPLQGTLGVRHAALHLRVRGQGRFTLLIADGARSAAEDPLPLGAIEAGAEWADHLLVLPASGWQPGDWQALTLACPDTEAAIEIASAELIFADRTVQPGTRALWVWNPKAWMSDPEVLLARLHDTAAAEVFVSVPLRDEACQGEDCAVAHPEALARFLALAAQAGIQVWAVAGDPAAVLPEERAAWIGRASAYARFDRALGGAPRLAGIQYDIEPYLVPGYAQASAAWDARYLDLLHDLRAAGGALAVDVVVPWWFAQTGGAAPDRLEKLAAVADRLTVMDYRTDALQITRSALPFLDWGRRAQRAIHIALESGPLPDLDTRRYARADRGELWLFRLGDQTVYTLLDAPAAPPAGVSVFAARGGHRVRAAQTTFHGRPDALWREVAALEQAFGGAAAFAGVAIHGLDQTWY